VRAAAAADGVFIQYRDVAQHEVTVAADVLHWGVVREQLPGVQEGVELSDRAAR
jgi:hypothetical protein